MEEKELLELQCSIIEWQKNIIGELMRLYSTEPEFHIPEELQQQIDEATQGVMDAQAAAQTGRNKLGIYATQEYKTGGISLIKVLLESQSISDLVNNMQYFDAIQEDQARQIAEQKQLEATLNDALDDLNKKKDEQASKDAFR